VIAIKPYCIPIYFYLTWACVTGSVHAAEPVVDNESAVSSEESADAGDSETQWTMGLGLGMFSYQYYPGAKESNQLFLPAPYFTYRSPKFEVDRGIKSFIYHSEEIIVDVSADFGLPVDSDDTIARKGMPDLDFVLQLGPSLEFLLNDRRKNYFDARFELPVRIAATADVTDMQAIGYLIEPRFTLAHRRESQTGLTHKATMGLKFASREYHAYYYDVAAEFVTPSRSEYKSDAGFSGSFINYRLSYKTSDFVYWTFIRYQSLHGAEFENSPLVLEKDYYFFGIGFAWIFASSV